MGGFDVAPATGASDGAPAKGKHLASNATDNRALAALAPSNQALATAETALEIDDDWEDF